DLGGRDGVSASRGVYGYDDDVSDVDVQVVDVRRDRSELSPAGDGPSPLGVDGHYALEGLIIIGIVEDGEAGQILDGGGADGAALGQIAQGRGSELGGWATPGEVLMKIPHLVQGVRVFPL